MFSSDFVIDLFLSPATKLGQGYVFTGVCHSVNRGVSASVHAGITPPRADPPRADTPQEQTPPKSRHLPEQTPPKSRHPPRADTPQEQTPQEQTPPKSRHPPEQTPPPKSRSRPTPKGEVEGDQIQVHTQGGNWGGSDLTPQRRACWEIRSTRGWYASYWNAFLFQLSLLFWYGCHNVPLSIWQCIVGQILRP